MPDPILDLEGLRTLAASRSRPFGDVEGEAAVMTAIATARRRGITTALSELSPEHATELQAALDELDELDVVRTDTNELARDVLDRAHVSDDVRDKLLAEIDARNIGFAQNLALPDGALDGVILDDFPELQPELRRAEVVGLAAIAGLNDAATEAVLARAANIESLADQRLATLVIEGDLQEKDAQRLGVLAGLAQMAGGKVEPVARLAKADFSGLRGGVSSFRDVLRVDPDELAKVIEPELAQNDPEAARAEAEGLRIRVEERFPTIGLEERLARPANADVRAALQTSRDVLRDAPDVLSGVVDPDQLDEAGRVALNEVRGLVNTYPGLGLDKIVIASGAARTMATAIARRIDVFDSFAKENEGVDFLRIDTTPGSDDLKALKFDGISDEDRDAVLSVVKTRARVFNVGGTVRRSSSLMKAGLHSAMTIADADRNDIARRAGIPLHEADIVIANARDTRLGVGSLMAGLVDELRWPRPEITWLGPLLEDVTDGLRRLPGYEELFGDQSFCDCAHCDSILSPAAYFVDLMTFVDEKVTRKEFIGAKENHALKLQERRPDLWTTPLTCDTTHEYVPTLQIINQILETAMATRADNTINANDRRAIEESVYEDLLPGATRSFVTPFDLRTARAEIYLRDFDTDRAEIIKLLTPDAGTAAANAAALKLPMVAYNMITTARTQWGFLMSLYRMAFPRTGGVANPFDVQDIMAGIEADRDTFEALVETEFVEGADNIRIVSQKRSLESVQNDIERVLGMTQGALDRLHRFWRLSKALDLDPDSLDAIVTQSGGALNDTTIARVIAVRELAERFDLEIDEALALVSPIPTSPIGTDQDEPSLMDRLFNGATRAPEAAAFPAPALRFVHPGLRDNAALPETGPNAGVFVSQRLRLAFGLDETELLDLILALANTLGLDPEAPAEADRGFLLSEANLTLLYRHTVLAEGLRMSIPELALAIQAGTGGAAITTPGQISMLLGFVDALDSVPVGLEQAAALMGLGDTSAVFLDADAVASGVVTSIGSGQTTLFAPTVFAYLDGVTEDQSREIISANSGLFEPAERDMLRLRADLDMAPVIVAPPTGFPSGVLQADLQAALQPFNLRHLIPVETAAALDISPDKLDAVLLLAGTSLTAQAIIDAAIVGDTAPLAAVLSTMARPLAALADDAITAHRVTFIDANRVLFGIVDPLAPYDRETVLGLAAYQGVLADDDGLDGYAEAVDAVLLGYVPATAFSGVSTEMLSRATGGNAANVRVFEAGANLPPLAIHALHQLRRIIEFANDRTLTADALALLASETPESLGQGAESLVAAMRLRITDPESFDAAMERHEDALRGLRRDALTDHIIRNSNGRFDSRGDLYNYYLIDPDMEGCARTSLVVSAIGSLQSYVHRILLNLEQDRREPDAANHVHISPTRIPADEWEWRKNYRVWEANRKVFLWPENYMLPELRDNKTPQFEMLEKTLLQQDITEQTVLDAYAEYLRSFEEVAGLRIAGAFHEQNLTTKKDVLHVFGCTPADPPEYYYWTIENLTFSKLDARHRISYSARHKIDVAIPVRDVSPFIYNNRLHLFWVEITTRSRTEIQDGEQVFSGYKHTLTPKFTFLRLDGTWAPPQAIEMLGDYFTIRQGGKVSEGVGSKNSINSRTVPFFSDETMVAHNEYQETYTLRVPAWKKVFPGVHNGQLYLCVGAHQVPFRVDLFERKAYTITSGERQILDIYWKGDLAAMYLSGSGSTRPIREQSIQWPSFCLPSPYAARQSFVQSRWDLRSNLMGWVFGDSQYESVIPSFNLDSSDLGAPVAQANAVDPHVVVPVSDWGLPEILVQKGSDISYFAQSFDWDGRPYEARRLGTTVLTDLSRTLFYGGVEGLLDRKAQLDFSEYPHLITSRYHRTRVVGPTDSLDYKGPLGVYFRELFFHIPALLASHQNARGNYAAAQGWYQTIFDPTAKFDSSVNLGSLSDSARLQAERDRVWQYAEFQGMAPPTLRTILTDEDAQEAYRKDPFNPFAIGRLRLSAFQKNIVMRYCDNLLDWADSLFRQFTRESVDEAHILYDLVRQILGPRPADAGDCGEGRVRPRTYARIKPHLEQGQDFLIEAETWYLHHQRFVGSGSLTLNAERRFVEVERFDTLAVEMRGSVESRVNQEMRFDKSRPISIEQQVAEASRGITEQFFGEDKTVSDLPDALTAEPAAPVVAAHVAEGVRFVEARERDGVPGRQIDWMRTGRVDSERANIRNLGVADRNGRVWDRIHPDAFTYHVTRQVGPVFCVPRNKDLLELWDRVADRLYKIHNCRNIDGERVDLALFAPEIDPLALVRAKAAGLSLSDILGASAGNLPPYRFTFLVAKAREYAGLVQSFGARLQSAIERRDAEELAKLRLTQAINMQNIVTKIRENEVKIAKENLAEANRRKETLEYRESFYADKISTDLLPWERTEQVLTHAAGASKILGALFKGTAGVIHLIPGLGSPFAMKYGGKEVGDSTFSWGDFFKDSGDMLSIIAKSASLEAKYANKRKEWKHNEKLEQLELKQHEKRIKAAEIRVEIAEKALENHQQAISDQEEILDFYESKFSGEELFTWMASTMQTIYRQAFNAAFSMAKMAEQAYRFERPSDQAQLLELTYWEPGFAGLLSGEKLAVDLLEMEKRYIETNYRTLEVTQPFSLGELNPAALMTLRETGECDFTIPELAFDLLYPGQYRRSIRAVRLSIACVTGPYVNIPATLTLTGAKIRIDPTLDGAAGLSDTMLRHTVQIATSTAQNDSGVFDFSFGDPRYMPFEGAGAVESEWKVTLPKTFRPFDYETINDVIVHISYTAESDGVLRDRVETDNAALEGALIGLLEDVGLPRAFSLRQEFGTEFHQLLTGPLGSDAVISLDDRAVPYPMRGREILVDRALMLLRVADGLASIGTELRVNGVVLDGFVATPEFPGYVLADAAAAFAGGLVGDHTVAFIDAGDLGNAGDPTATTDGSVEDIVFYFEVSLD